MSPFFSIFPFSLKPIRKEVKDVELIIMYLMLRARTHARTVPVITITENALGARDWMMTFGPS